MVLVAFEGMTLLDLIGFYDPLVRLNTMGFIDDLGWDVCSYTAITRDQNGLRILPTMIARPLTDYDVLYVPGGFSTRTLTRDGGFLEWLRTAKETPLKISVCTGSLLLGAAGFLAGKAATTHPDAVQLLEPLCEEVSGERICDSGDIITGGGVTASIDVGLHFCQRVGGSEARESIQKQIDYQRTG